MYSLSISIRKNTQILLCTLFSGWQKNYWYCFLLFFYCCFLLLCYLFPAAPFLTTVWHCNMCINVGREQTLLFLLLFSCCRTIAFLCAFVCFLFTCFGAFYLGLWVLSYQTRSIVALSSGFLKPTTGCIQLVHCSTPVFYGLYLCSCVYCALKLQMHDLVHLCERVKTWKQGHGLENRELSIVWL